MTFTNTTRTTASACAMVAASAMFASAASAQIVPPMPDIAPISDAEIGTLPPELQTGPVTNPVVDDFSETTVGPDGVETIVRTRRIESNYPAAAAAHTAPVQHHSQAYAPAAYPQPTYASYAPGATVFQREQWIDECERRIDGRSDRERGGIIGGLLGAITGGIIGNRVADSERLGGTLLGAGLGGLGGLVLGNLIGGGRNDRGDYDCEAALDSYLSQYGQPGAYPVQRVAARTIPAPAYAPAPVQYGYSYAPAYAYTYQPPQQIVYVPIEYQQQQRVIVRETVREELVPGAARTIPAPAPQPLPAPVPSQPRLIKGN